VGLGRVAEDQFSEALILAGRIPERFWTWCVDPLARACLAGAKTYRLMNAFEPAALCGPIVFVRTEPYSAPQVSGAGHRPGSLVVARLTCAG